MCDTAMPDAVTCRAALKTVGKGGARWIVVGLLTAAPCVWAQQSPAPAPSAREVPRPDELEPGVNTSATPAPATTVSPGSSATPVSGSSAGAGNGASSAPNTGTSPPKAAAKGSARAKPAAPSKADAPAGTQAPSDSKVPKAGAGGKAQDRLQLDATQITGNQELPKVLYIVPWKRSDLGDLIGKPVNSLLDEVLEPVDRDVFKRENRYYDALQPDAAAAGQGSGDKR
jgi:hypothetical protein